MERDNNPGRLNELNERRTLVSKVWFRHLRHKRDLSSGPCSLPDARMRQASAMPRDTACSGLGAWRFQVTATPPSAGRNRHIAVHAATCEASCGEVDSPTSVCLTDRLLHRYRRSPRVAVIGNAEALELASFPFKDSKKMKWILDRPDGKQLSRQNEASAGGAFC